MRHDYLAIADCNLKYGNTILSSMKQHKNYFHLSESLVDNEGAKYLALKLLEMNFRQDSMISILQDVKNKKLSLDSGLETARNLKNCTFHCENVEFVFIGFS